MTTSSIRKVLIANRGEIARRIQRACKKLGIASVTVASEADKNSLFAREAEELVVIGPAPAKESYLAIDKLIAAAKQHACDAVHPGYGFLSENAEFAQAVIDAGLIFIGPDPATIETLGSKTSARAQVQKFGVPTTPGCRGGLSDAEIIKEAEKIGYPLIIKAVGGGGGRGMRVVNSTEELGQMLPRARAEAKKNFSSEDVYFEKYISHPRHVEVQIFGDGKGQVLHFGTRDCSTQRRHQKLIEEAPAPQLSDELREKIHAAAVNAGKSVNYKNAGTAEFLVAGQDFFFLEMNTRIQVEHPVTEVVTGVDLVELQLKVAGGAPLGMKQEDVRVIGHAIEFRLYAEAPAQNFQPAVGRITDIKRPVAPYIREDYALAAGDEVTPHYDAMISKLIVSGATRTQAIARSVQALAEYEIKGLATTIDFHRWMLDRREFRRGPVDIGFVEREFNAEKLREFRAKYTRDPRHQRPIGGAEMKNVFEYQSKKFRTTYTIEVVHRNEGFFLATPIGSDGRRAAKRNCRMSNGMDTVVESLISEVLEKVNPTELFSS